MHCSCDSAVTDADMEPRRTKEGDIMKYKTGFLGSKWKSYHAVLFSDSKFCWYDEKVCWERIARGFGMSPFTV
ncbi:hypothetical protein GCK32_010919, partial [Trichostrongylus colubriformis]